MTAHGGLPTPGLEPQPLRGGRLQPVTLPQRLLPRRGDPRRVAPAGRDRRPRRPGDHQRGRHRPADRGRARPPRPRPQARATRATPTGSGARGRSSYAAGTPPSGARGRSPKTCCTNASTASGRSSRPSGTSSWQPTPGCGGPSSAIRRPTTRSGWPTPRCPQTRPGCRTTPTPGPPSTRSSAVRAGRMATVARVLGELTDERLAERTEPVLEPGYPESESFEVRRCLGGGHQRGVAAPRVRRARPHGPRGAPGVSRAAQRSSTGHCIAHSAVAMS